MGMSKEEFVRKMVGHSQHVKNERIKRLRENGREADSFTYGTSDKIRAKKRQAKGV